MVSWNPSVFLRDHQGSLWRSQKRAFCFPFSQKTVLISTAMLWCDKSDHSLSKPLWRRTLYPRDGKAEKRQWAATERDGLGINLALASTDFLTILFIYEEGTDTTWLVLCLSPGSLTRFSHFPPSCPSSRKCTTHTDCSHLLSSS